MTPRPIGKSRFVDLVGTVSQNPLEPVQKPPQRVPTHISTCPTKTREHYNSRDVSSVQHGHRLCFSSKASVCRLNNSAPQTIWGATHRDGRSTQGNWAGQPYKCEPIMITAVLLTAMLGVEGTNLDANAATLRIGSWLPRLGGTVADGGGSVDLESNIDLRKREETLLFEFGIRGP